MGTRAVAVEHPEVVEAARRALGASRMAHPAGMVRVWGDPRRVAVLTARSVGELCDCDLVASLDVDQSSASHQLRLWCKQRLMRPQRRGYLVNYRLDADCVPALCAAGVRHLAEERR